MPAGRLAGSKDAARLIGGTGRAEAVYDHLKTGYEVDRGIGLVTAAKLLARLAAAALKMPISTWLRAASTLKSCAPPVTR